MPRTDAQKRAEMAYRKKCKKLQITLYPTEQDIIDKVNSQGSYSEYIKNLIRQDIERSN